MVITIGSETICDGADRTAGKNAGPSGLRLIGRRATQVLQYLRATDAEPVDRGNRTSELSFSIKRLCASVAAAEEYCALHPASVTGSGTLTMTNASSAVRMLNAVLDTVDCSYVGATVFVNYHATGGKLEIVP